MQEDRMQDEDHNPPMSSPTPFLLGIAIGAVLLLGGLMVADFAWQMSGPETVVTASAPAPVAPPVTTPVN
jgi:hypothetical protein